MKTIELIYTNSLTNKFLSALMKWFYQSMIYKIISVIVDFSNKQYQKSQFKHFFLTRNSFFSSWFRGGIFEKFILISFGLIHWILDFCRLAYQDSFLQIFVQYSKKDLTQNWLKYSASILYSSFVMYALLTLFFGSGFTRSEMVNLILVVFLLFGLSQIQGDSNKFLENSVILRWIQKIYL